MTAAGVVSYAYDNNGNQTARGSDSFNWDYENRLSGATVGGTSATYVYRGDGLRHSKTVGGNTTTYTWDVNDSLPIVLQDGAYTYVYGLDLISQTDASGVQSYFLANGLGSTEALTDGSGNIIGTYKYDVFGAVRSSSGSGSTEYRFTGQQDDATLGYTYLRARYYDPAVGRFPSKDLVPAPLQRPQAINDYVYVADDPANLADPSGLWCPRNLEDCKDLIPRPDKEIKRAWNFWTKTVPDVASKGYVDVGVTICYWGCGTFGAQFGRGQGFHPYFGGGIGSPGGGLAVNLLPYQSISQVWSCGLGGGYAIFPEPVGVGWGGEAGFSGISFKGSWPFIEGSFYAASGPFVGLSGISGTLYYVFPEPW